MEHCVTLACVVGHMPQVHIRLVLSRYNRIDYFYVKINILKAGELAYLVKVKVLPATGA